MPYARNFSQSSASRIGLVLHKFFWPALALLALTACDVVYPPGSVEVWVFNKTKGILEVAGQSIDYWTSATVILRQGQSQRLAITRNSQVLDTLVLTSLVSPGEKQRYGAAVNVEEDSLSGLRTAEYSPYIDAYLTGIQR